MYLPRQESPGGTGKGKVKEDLPAFFDTSSYSRLAILNGSHRSISEEPNQLTVVVLPDFKFITDVGRSKEDAEHLWNTNLSFAIGRAGISPSTTGDSYKPPLKSWPLPYDAVILICMCYEAIILVCLSHAN